MQIKIVARSCRDYIGVMGIYVYVHIYIYVDILRLRLHMQYIGGFWAIQEHTGLGSA